MRIHTIIPTWYVGMVPLDMLKLETQDSSGKDWFAGLRRDIEANGLNNPIVVANRPEMQFEMRVMVGSNRVRAVRQLGWNVVPCIIYGELPTVLAGVKLTSLKAIQNCLVDGEVFEHCDGGICVKDAPRPEETYKNG